MPFAVFGLLGIALVVALLLFAASASIGLLVGRYGLDEGRESRATPETRPPPVIQSVPQTEPAPAPVAHRPGGTLASADGAARLARD